MWLVALSAGRLSPVDRESGYRATAKSQPAICPFFFFHLLFVSINCQLQLAVVLGRE